MLTSYFFWFLTLLHTILCLEKACTIYPNENYSDYKTCDEQYVYQLIKNGSNNMPFWATDNISEITTLRYLDLQFDKKFDSMQYEFFIFKSSNSQLTNQIPQAKQA